MKAVGAPRHQQDSQSASHSFIHYPFLCFLESILAIEPGKIILEIEAFALILYKNRHLLVVHEKVYLHPKLVIFPASM